MFCRCNEYLGTFIIKYIVFNQFISPNVQHIILSFSITLTLRLFVAQKNIVSVQGKLCGLLSEFVRLHFLQH